MAAQGESKRFLGALKAAAMQQGSALLSVAAMYSTADAIELQQDVHQLIELLNDACAALCPQIHT